MNKVEEIMDLVDEYWLLAYNEGADNRSHDTEEGDAQRVRFAIECAVIALLQAERRQRAAPNPLT